MRNGKKANAVPLLQLDLVCPNCKPKLDSADDCLRCPKCGESWPVVDGIPYFIQSAQYWGEVGISQEDAQQIIKQAENGSWHDALKGHPGGARHYSFIADLDRAKWFKMLSLPSESIVLDLGAGLGTISQSIARDGAHVYAVERVEERVQFMRLRFRQEGCTNIKIIRSDIDHLPFSERSFDLIVLNGVLEWLPFSRKQDNPREAQLYYLGELRKLLKPKGVLYIGIENRFNYDFIVGAPDPHIGVKFVTVLPRWVANLICTIQTGDRYRPYLYSPVGYQKLLAQAGFAESEVFSALPSYNNPRVIRSLESQSGIRRSDLAY